MKSLDYVFWHFNVLSRVTLLLNSIIVQVPVAALVELNILRREILVRAMGYRFINNVINCLGPLIQLRINTSLNSKVKKLWTLTRNKLWELWTIFSTVCVGNHLINIFSELCVSKFEIFLLAYFCLFCPRLNNDTDVYYLQVRIELPPNISLFSFTMSGPFFFVSGITRDKLTLTVDSASPAYCVHWSLPGHGHKPGLLVCQARSHTTSR